MARKKYHHLSTSLATAVIVNHEKKLPNSLTQKYQP
jgi:hypothetical protein